jgi:hypothetical protein
MIPSWVVVQEELENMVAEALPFLHFQTYSFNEESVKSLITHAVRHALEVTTICHDSSCYIFCQVVILLCTMQCFIFGPTSLIDNFFATNI